MNSLRIAAIVLIVAGVLGLIYGGFSFTRETHKASVGSVDLSISESESVNIPIWAGVAAIVIGGGLLVAGGKR